MMKPSTALLCLALAPLTALASEDIAVFPTISATECHEISGAKVCTVMLENNLREAVVALSDCDQLGEGSRLCHGKWEGTHALNGRNYDVKITAQKYSFTGFDGTPSAAYDLTASFRAEGGAWRAFHVNMNDRATLTDTIQIDGNDVALSDGSLTPALSLSPAISSATK